MSAINRPIIQETYTYRGEGVVIKILANCPDESDRHAKNFDFGIQSIVADVLIYDFGTYNYKRVGRMKKEASRAARRFIRTAL